MTQIEKPIMTQIEKPIMTQIEKPIMTQIEKPIVTHLYNVLTWMTRVTRSANSHAILSMSGTILSSLL